MAAILDLQPSGHHEAKHFYWPQGILYANVEIENQPTWNFRLCVGTEIHETQECRVSTPL